MRVAAAEAAKKERHNRPSDFGKEQISHKLDAIQEREQIGFHKGHCHNSEALGQWSIQSQAESQSFEILLGPSPQTGAWSIVNLLASLYFSILIFLFEFAHGDPEIFFRQCCRADRHARAQTIILHMDQTRDPHHHSFLLILILLISFECAHGVTTTSSRQCCRAYQHSRAPQIHTHHRDRTHEPHHHHHHHSLTSTLDVVSLSCVIFWFYAVFLWISHLQANHIRWQPTWISHQRNMPGKDESTRSTKCHNTTTLDGLMNPNFSSFAQKLTYYVDTDVTSKHSV